MVTPCLNVENWRTFLRNLEFMYLFEPMVLRLSLFMLVRARISEGGSSITLKRMFAL